MTLHFSSNGYVVQNLLFVKVKLHISAALSTQSEVLNLQ